MDILDKELIKELQDKFDFIDIDTESDCIKIKFDFLKKINKENLFNMLELIDNTEQKTNEENILNIKSMFDMFNKMYPSYANTFNISYDNRLYYVNFMIDNLSCGYKINLKNNEIYHVDRLMIKQEVSLNFLPENIYILHKEKMDRIELINNINVNSIYFSSLCDKVNILEYFIKNGDITMNEDIEIATELINKIYSRIKYGEIHVAYNKQQNILFTTNMKSNFVNFSVTVIDEFIDNILLQYPHLKL